MPKHHRKINRYERSSFVSRVQNLQKPLAKWHKIREDMMRHQTDRLVSFQTYRFRRPEGGERPIRTREVTRPYTLLYKPALTNMKLIRPTPYSSKAFKIPTQENIFERRKAMYDWLRRNDAVQITDPSKSKFSMIATRAGMIQKAGIQQIRDSMEAENKAKKEEQLRIEKVAKNNMESANRILENAINSLQQGVSDPSYFKSIAQAIGQENAARAAAVETMLTQIHQAQMNQGLAFDGRSQILTGQLEEITRDTAASITLQTQELRSIQHLLRRLIANMGTAASAPGGTPAGQPEGQPEGEDLLDESPPGYVMSDHIENQLREKLAQDIDAYERQVGAPPSPRGDVGRIVSNTIRAAKAAGLSRELANLLTSQTSRTRQLTISRLIQAGDQQLKNQLSEIYPREVQVAEEGTGPTIRSPIFFDLEDTPTRQPRPRGPPRDQPQGSSATPSAEPSLKTSLLNRIFSPRTPT